MSAWIYNKGKRGIAGEQLYSHFLEAGHKGIEDMRVRIIDKTNVNDPTNREGFWAYKLNSFIPQGLNLRDFLQISHFSNFVFIVKFCICNKGLSIKAHDLL